MKPYHTTQRGHIYRARAEDVYPHLPDRSCSLVIWDGPYNMRKADWDKFDSWDAFRDWYRPHLKALDRVACDAASLYVWGTDESASQLRGMIADAGWNRRVRVTWDKPNAPSQKIGIHALTWPDKTEVCDVYIRGPADHSSFVAACQKRMREALDSSGLTRSAIDQSAGTSNVSQYWWQPRSFRLPSNPHRDMLDALRPGHFPWSQLDKLWRDGFAAYEAKRVAFNLQDGMGNVWRTPIVVRGRLQSASGRSVHDCQKPLAFWSRIIRASSRPGDTVLEPFGGTCRAAFACLDLPESKARRYVCIEPDEDGRDYLGAVVKSLRERQPTLWGVR